MILCDAQPSVGRKFLVAGRGGLNLTHGEPRENFPLRYGAEQERCHDLLTDFSPDDLRAWAAELGTETYVDTSGRVFPKGQKAANLLRGWVRRLQSTGVQLRSRLKLSRLAREGEDWRAEFNSGETTVVARAVVLALGGASWPDTGSDGTWTNLLQEHGVEIAPWLPANCGWEVDWPNEFLERAEGLPLKNLTVSAGGESVSGELLITRYGLEGGAIYRLTPLLRAMPQPTLRLDLKPQLATEALLVRLETNPAVPWAKVLKLSPAAAALLETLGTDGGADRELLVRQVKHFELQLRRPRPIEEAISSAGGIRWRELDRMLMLRKLPGVFVAGEMIDWEAPTGGYLLQGCFATGTRAGRSAAAFARKP